MGDDRELEEVVYQRREGARLHKRLWAKAIESCDLCYTAKPAISPRR